MRISDWSSDVCSSVSTTCRRDERTMLHAHLDGATRPAIGGPPALPVDHPPLLLVVIDTEEEFDWHLPHSRDNTSVRAIAAPGPAQPIYARHDKTGRASSRERVGPYV